MNYISELVTGLTAGFSLIIKTRVHRLIDIKNNYPMRSLVPMAPIYLLPYRKPVSEKTARLKKICNALWIFFAVFFSVLIVLKIVH